MPKLGPIKCVIVDIDSTIADISHRLHMLPKLTKEDGSYEPSGRCWDEFHAAAVDDKPIAEIIELVELIAAAYPIILCTGRGEETREKTIAWLNKHGVFFDDLYMRPYGDFRKDTVVKGEMLANLRADGYDPIMAFDDRTAVVKMFREAGVRCLQVCDGDY